MDVPKPKLFDQDNPTAPESVKVPKDLDQTSLVDYKDEGSYHPLPKDNKVIPISTLPLDAISGAGDRVHTPGRLKKTAVRALIAATAIGTVGYSGHLERQNPGNQPYNPAAIESGAHPNADVPAPTQDIRQIQAEVDQSKH
jgi:hypothetical protein